MKTTLDRINIAIKQGLETHGVEGSDIFDEVISQFTEKQINEAFPTKGIPALRALIKRRVSQLILAEQDGPAGVFCIRCGKPMETDHECDTRLIY